jgi:hypothetical protein
MRIYHWNDKIQNVEVCCNEFWNWLINGLLHVHVEADGERCTITIAWNEENIEKISFCPFCGTKIEFEQQ